MNRFLSMAIGGLCGRFEAGIVTSSRRNIRYHLRMQTDTKRRQLLRRLIMGSAGAAALPGCSDDPGKRYKQRDIDLLAQQRREETAASGKGPYGTLRYRGYRGLAELPWFDLDEEGRLLCSDERIPLAIDVHSHLGISVLFEPELDLQAHTPRVRHLLDCDRGAPGCALDLDVYINSNFGADELDDLSATLRAQGLWGSEVTATHTIPNLLHEMDAMRVEHAVILPIKLGLPFGDRLTENWRSAIAEAGVSDRLHGGLSVHPRDGNRLQELRRLAASGARVMKLHPTVQKFYPDDPELMTLYEEADALGLVVFFHGGRAGIEPEARLRYAMPRHYEAVLSNFPRLQVVLGHAGARDSEAMVELALRHDNAWLGVHGQGVTRLDSIIQRTGGARLLFGTDWPWYHIGATLAKVLLCTQRSDRRDLRQRILRDNALTLFPELSQQGIA